MSQNSKSQSQGERKVIKRDLNQLAPLLNQQLIALNKENIVVDLVTDYSDIQELNKLAWDVTHPEDSSGTSNLALIDMPIKVGDIYLFRLSIGSNVWLEECAFQWWQDNEYLFNVSIAYAMAYGRNPDFLFNIADKKTAEKTLNKWARKVSVTADELADAVAKLLPQQDNTENVDNNEDTNPSYNPTVSLLMNEYGQNENHWVWEDSVDNVLARVQDFNHKQREEAKANAEAGGSSLPPDPNDPQVQAMERFRLRFIKFMDKKKGKEDG